MRAIQGGNVLSAWRMRTCKTEKCKIQCRKRRWELQQDFAKAEERKLPGGRLVRRRRRRRRKRELTCFKCVQKSRQRPYGENLSQASCSQGQVGILGHWVHTQRTLMLAICNMRPSLSAVVAALCRTGQSP